MRSFDRVAVRVAACLLALFPVATAAVAAKQAQCRCVPGQACWPSARAWRQLNNTINGHLIANVPIAISCYQGPLYNEEQCAYVDENWTNATFQQQSPVGYVYPLVVDCPPVNVSAGAIAQGECILGDAPVFTVNATTVAHVQAGIAFARKHNLRLVIRDTGHDSNGRSAGYGSLQVWIKYLRTGITYHDTFEQKGSSWNGSAITIGGGYVWSDIYPVAEKHGKIVVGGGTPSVSCLGGWMQGGGHSPATHDYGVGADQVLQARVVLADGSLVTASPCENRDLFFAIRGGGPGTYGIVIETTVKAWPTTSVVAQTLAFAPLTANDTAEFMASLADFYQALPDLSDAGWSGYGEWTVDGFLPVFSNFSTGYAGTFATFGRSLKDSMASFQPLRKRLAAKNGTSLYVYLTYTEEPTYAQYYNAFSGTEQPAGSFSLLGSRFLDRKALTANRTALLNTLNVVAGSPGQYTTNVVEFLGGENSQVARDGNPATAAVPVSGLNPAWRTMVVSHITTRGWTEDTPQATINAIDQDITNVKVAALKQLAPDTGAYMNEADRLDPDWAVDFYGRHWEQLSAIKRQLDPSDTFYCPTCVGSERWHERPSGQLCRIQ